MVVSAGGGKLTMSDKYGKNEHKGEQCSEGAQQTGRSLSAVYSRRSTLGLNNGRTTRHQRASGN